MRYKAGLETKDRIIEATRSLIAETGLEGTTIKAICDKAGVLPGSLYNLFESKEQTILAVVRQAIDAVDPDPDRQGTDTVDDLIEAYLKFVLDQPDLARVYVRIAVSGTGDEAGLRGRLLRHHEGRVARFAEAIRRQHPRLKGAVAAERAETLVTSLNGMVIHKVLDPGFDVAGQARNLAGLIAPSRWS